MLVVLIVVGKILLWLLIIIFVMINMLLWIPFRYQLDGSTRAATAFELRISWLFSLVKYIRKRVQEKKEVAFYIACYDLTKKKHTINEKTLKNENVRNRKSERVLATETTVKTTKAAVPTQEAAQKGADAKKEAENDSGATGKGSQNIKENIKEKLIKTKALLTYPDRQIIITLSIALIKKLLRVLKPDKIQIDGIIGFDDPYTTGICIGMYEAAASMLGLRNAVRLKGIFDQSALSLEYHLQGKIVPGLVLLPVLWYCMHKPIFKLIKSYVVN